MEALIVLLTLGIVILTIAAAVALEEAIKHQDPSFVNQSGRPRSVSPRAAVRALDPPQ